jgi:hypothetical protein
MKISRARSVLADRAQPKHSSEYPRYWSAKDTILGCPKWRRPSIRFCAGRQRVPPKTRMEVLDLLVELQNLSTRRSLIDWCRHCGFEPAAHHRLLITELEKVACGDYYEKVPDRALTKAERTAVTAVRWKYAKASAALKRVKDECIRRGLIDGRTA